MANGKFETAFFSVRLKLFEFFFKLWDRIETLKWLYEKIETARHTQLLKKRDWETREIQLKFYKTCNFFRRPFWRGCQNVSHQLTTVLSQDFNPHQMITLARQTGYWYLEIKKYIIYICMHLCSASQRGNQNFEAWVARAPCPFERQTGSLANLLFCLQTNLDTVTVCYIYVII